MNKINHRMALFLSFSESTQLNVKNDIHKNCHSLSYRYTSIVGQLGWDINYNRLYHSNLTNNNFDEEDFKNGMYE